MSKSRRSANLRIYVHSVHPSHHPQARIEAYEWGRTVQFTTAVCQILAACTGHFSAAFYIRPPYWTKSRTFTIPFRLAL